MRIAISGKSGCGNTTVSTLLAKKLGYPVINFTFRQLANEKGVDFWTLSKAAETDHSIDRELDDRQVRMAMSHESCILGSRLAIWVLKDADLKVYLNASSAVRAERITQREGGTFSERLKETEERDRRNTQRYIDIYNIDDRAYEGIADIVIDTALNSPEEITEIIIRTLKERGML